MKMTQYHFLPIRLGKIKLIYNNQCWQGCRERNGPLEGRLNLQKGNLAMPGNIFNPHTLYPRDPTY